MAEITDIEKQSLVEGAKKNDRKAQNKLFGHYSGLVMSVSRRYGKDLSAAEDVFQECFMQIFRSLVASKNEIDNLDGWIYRIAINTNITHYYKNKEVAFEELSDQQLDDHHRKIIDRISGEELMNMINHLPDGYRVIFNLYFIDGYKHTEIAKMLGISESTSRSQLSRAKEQLKKELESQGIDRYEAN
ncbi:RNA polymerase sigma factor [Ekhidna sp. To15]|uniref:RNA polymerase sigma factor n=1 Tax=Ekhidna sp. To15 TaxID=3395267 RepID=UPI003F5230C6